MRAILINDTRSDQHIGCQLVVENTFKLSQLNGIEITTSVTNAEALDASQLVSAQLTNNDLLLLNGEGTLHDDKPKALALLEAAKSAKEAGLRTILYNALWRNNSEAANFLKYFDQIYCRDSKSAELVSEHAPCVMVPDMIFATDLPADHQQKSQRLLVTDSVKKSISRELARFAIRRASLFSPMGMGFERCLKSRPLLAWRLSKKCSFRRGEVDPPDEFINKISQAHGVVTGRFHTACLALLCGTPVACVSSNTNKIETLFQDFGLTSDLTSSSNLSKQALELQWSEQRMQRHSIDDQISLIRKKIDSMFVSFSS